MALHDPVEDALNERKRKARLVEAGAAVGSPSEEALGITKRFLTGGQRLPSQAAPVAGRSAFGQQGARRRPGGSLITPGPAVPDPAQPLSSRLFDLPGPVGFAQTPRGSAILQSILSRFSQNRLRR
jgi:hypothetical protein